MQTDNLYNHFIPTDMPKLKRPIFKFSINNLILVNSVYPFDFFIRVNNFKNSSFSQSQSQVSENEQCTSQDSPIIKANADECDEVFPWEFAVNSSSIKLEFVEISKVNNNEIIRSEHTVDEITEEEGKTIVMNAHRSGKKLCIIHYILEPYIPLESNSERHNTSEFSTSQSGMKSSCSKSGYKEEDEESISENNSNRWNRKTQNDHNENKNGINRNEQVALSEKEHKELEKQIAEINKSIDRILDHEKSEHALFSKYLDESTTFIKEIMMESKANKNKFDFASAELACDLESHSIANPKLLCKEENLVTLSPHQQEIKHESKILHKEQIIPKDKEELAMESICESELTDSELSSAKWYKEKYNKDKPPIYKNKNFRVDAPGPDATYEISLKYSDSCENQNSMIFSDLEFNTEIKPNEISFIDPHSQSILFKAKSATGPSYDWKKSIEIPKLAAVIISVKDEFCNEEFNGCIAKREMEKMRVSLYNRKGEEKGQMKFKNKTIGFCSVQTQQMLNLIDKSCEEENEENEDKAKELNDANEISKEGKERISKEKAKIPEQEEHLSVYNKEQIAQNKPSHKIEPKKFTNQTANKSDVSLTKYLNPKENDLERLLIYESNVGTVTNKSEHEQNIEDLFTNSPKENHFLPQQQAQTPNTQINKQHSQIENNLIAKPLNSEVLEESNKEKNYLNSLEAVLKSRNSSFYLKEANNEFLNQSSVEKVYELPKTEEKPSRRPSRIRGLSVEVSRVNSRNTQIQERGELENKEGNKLINEKLNNFNIVSNSVSASYLPLMKKESRSQKFPESSFITDEELSEVGSSRQLSGIKGVSFKIDSISIKLLKNLNDFMGKFVKISMRNKNPYLTETINFSNNLTWKGKGYVFDNASPYGELIFYLYNDEHDSEVAIGKAKICLALLNLDKHNIVQFHHDFVRDESEEQIGEIILGYERIDKNRKALSASSRVSKYEEFFPVVFEESTKKKKRKATSREKTGSLREKDAHKAEKNRNFGVEKSQIKSIIGAASVIRTKKYTGGNIIIGRAARFRAAPLIEKPGPGDYEFKSSFEKHISPL